MTYDDFTAAFTARVGMPLPAALQLATGEAVTENELRIALTQRLTRGEFRLIVVVDAITPELRLIIEYLNKHTIDTVQILALELSYGRDDDVELLVPTVYGEESAAHKDRKTTAAKWNAATFAEQVQQRTAGSVLAFIESLLEHGTQKGHHPFYGSGATPGMSYFYELEGQPVSLWALYLNEPTPRQLSASVR
jgi:hypothetical protein